MASEDEPSKPEYIVPTSGQRGMTALHHASYLNDPDGVREALGRGIPVDARDDAGWTPLIWSIDMAEAWGEPEQVVAILLAAGASPNAVDTSGFSVLMMACRRNNEDILDQLIKFGADIHQRNERTSPLHEAAHHGFFEAIERLLALGAERNQTNASGQTPKQVAEECGFDQCVAVFKAARSED